ncbi:Clp protease N-terminal domain-containing protein [Nocardia thailandica]|uniref:Clp protease N-terminal domain-containing protein n=1 Tax=Nocardia thailandica TaxID=257275 RepID=UPI0002EEB362|nr:Clp protease N-terminal domain-containing protein [Nocardia thailandica]
MTTRDHSVTTITGWIPVGTERQLHRAAALSAEHGYNYLAEEHLLLAFLEDPRGFLAAHWPPDEPITLAQLRQVVLDNLPPVQAQHVGPVGAVQVSTIRTGPATGNTSN